MVPHADLLPIMARSFAVASLMNGRTLFTDSLKAGKAVGSANTLGRAKGYCSDQNV